MIVETRDAIYTYVIDDPPRDLTVPDTATWVLDPVPGEPEAKPTQALLTLTTCQDLFRSPDRSVGLRPPHEHQDQGLTRRDGVDEGLTWIGCGHVRPPDSARPRQPDRSGRQIDHDTADLIDLVKELAVVHGEVTLSSGRTPTTTSTCAG